MCEAVFCCYINIVAFVNNYSNEKQELSTNKNYLNVTKILKLKFEKKYLKIDKHLETLSLTPFANSKDIVSSRKA